MSLILVKANGFSKNSKYEYIRRVKPTDKRGLKTLHNNFFEVIFISYSFCPILKPEIIIKKTPNPYLRVGPVIKKETAMDMISKKIFFI